MLGLSLKKNLVLEATHRIIRCKTENKELVRELIMLM